MRKIFVVLLCGLITYGTLAGCASEKTMKENSEQINVDETDSKNDIEEPTVAETMNVVEGSDEISEIAETELLYECEVRAMGINAYLKFNIPKGFYYNENNSHILSIILEQADGERITVEFANEQYMNMLEEYMNNGVWNGIFDEQIESIADIETSYGTAKLLSGYRNEKKEIEHCYLDYEGCSWHIERIKGENSRPLVDVLNEMFAGKEVLEQGDTMHFQVEKINRDFLEDEYEKYLSEAKYVSGENKYELHNILGFHQMDGYDLHGTKIGSIDGVDACEGYEFTNYDGNNLTLYYTDYGIAHLKEVLTTGNGIYNLKLDDNNTLVSVEHKETLETQYGPAHILYQVKKSGEYNAENEYVILYVNDFEIIITYDYYSSDYSVLGYQGELAGIIPNMFAE